MIKDMTDPTIIVSGVEKVELADKIREGQVVEGRK